MFLSPTNLLYCASQKLWIYCVHCLQDIIEAPNVCKEVLFTLLITYLHIITSRHKSHTWWLQILFLLFTLKSLRILPTLGTIGKIEHGMFWKDYIHLIQPIYRGVQIGTHQRFVCSWYFILCISENMDTRRTLLIRENTKKSTFCKDYVHCLQPIHI